MALLTEITRMEVTVAQRHRPSHKDQKQRHKRSTHSHSGTIGHIVLANPVHRFLSQQQDLHVRLKKERLQQVETTPTHKQSEQPKKTSTLF